MHSKSKFQVLYEPTLSPRHFDGLGMSARQLHLWLRQIGWKDSRVKSRGWRSFSPDETLRLLTCRQLKTPTDFSLSRHPKLLDFLIRDRNFSEQVLNLYLTGNMPLLVTDMVDNHRVIQTSELDATSLFNYSSNVCVITELCTPVHKMIAATNSGGSRDQKQFVDELARNWKMATSNSDNTQNTDRASKAQAERTTGHDPLRKGRRKLNVYLSGKDRG